MNSLNAPTHKTVLVVDDDRSMRTTLVDILESEGFTAQAASSGEDAVAICEQGSVDIVLMDLRMPGIDGLEALRRIRALGAGTRVILMSAYGTDHDKHEALEGGAVAFVGKPLEIDAVLRLVAAVQSASILVVTSEQETGELLARELRERDFRVTVPGSTRAALDVMRQVRFDVAFIDAQLAEMSGLDFYLELRRSVPSVVAIMLHERDGELESIAAEAVRRTAYTKLSKPVDRSGLHQLVDVLERQLASGSVRKPGADFDA